MLKAPLRYRAGTREPPPPRPKTPSSATRIIFLWIVLTGSPRALRLNVGRVVFARNASMSNSESGLCLGAYSQWPQHISAPHADVDADRSSAPQVCVHLDPAEGAPNGIISPSLQPILQTGFPRLKRTRFMNAPASVTAITGSSPSPFPSKG